MAVWTVRRAEKINGLQYVVVKHEKSYEVSAWTNESPATLVAIDHDKDLEEAIKAVVNMVYKKNALAVLEKQGGLCRLCENRGQETDHIIPRSKGRNDRIVNLQILCSQHHRKKHGG